MIRQTLAGGTQLLGKAMRKRHAEGRKNGADQDSFIGKGEEGYRFTAGRKVSQNRPAAAIEGAILVTEERREEKSSAF